MRGEVNFIVYTYHTAPTGTSNDEHYIAASMIRTLVADIKVYSVFINLKTWHSNTRIVTS